MNNNYDKNTGGIINSVDDTLSEIGPVKATLMKTIFRGNAWNIKFEFDYKGKKIIDYSVADKDSKELNVIFGSRLLKDFLKMNPLFIKLDESNSISPNGKELPYTGRKEFNLPYGNTYVWEGTAYVPKDNSWYRDKHLESKLKR